MEKTRLANRCNSNNTDCKDYLTLTMYSSFDVKEIVRKYKSITEVLGTVGGNKEIILLVFSILFNIFYGRKQKLKIVKFVFGIEPEKTSCCKKKKQKQQEKYKVTVNQEKASKGQSSESSDQKSGAIQVSESVIDQAYQSIEQSLDVFALIRELNKIKMLLAHFMANSSQDAWQICYLNTYLTKNDAKTGACFDSPKKAVELADRSIRPLSEDTSAMFEQKIFNSPINIEPKSEERLVKNNDKRMQDPGSPNSPGRHYQGRETPRHPHSNDSDGKCSIAIRQDIVSRAISLMKRGQLSPWSDTKLHQLFSEEKCQADLRPSKAGTSLDDDGVNEAVMVRKLPRVTLTNI